MDFRWRPITRDSKRELKVILHPTAAIWEVRRGMEAGSDDSVDLTEFVKEVTQTAYDLKLSLVFNRELFGPTQPKPNQTIEVQLKQDDQWKILWLGHVDSISNFAMSRGERQMDVLAKTRDQQDIWRATPRVTPLFPALTDLVYMAQLVARSAEMKSDEIVLPHSAIATAHSNTQLVDMTNWEMVSNIFVALGWTPYIDALGRLRAADRRLQGREPDTKLDDDRIIKVGGTRMRPPVNRVRVKWLSPELQVFEQQRRVIKSFNVTFGFWLPYWHQTVKFSDDGSLRALKTECKPNPDGGGVFRWVQFGYEKWVHQSPTQGKFSIFNFGFFAMAGLLFDWNRATAEQDEIPILTVNQAFIPHLDVVVAGAFASEGYTLPGDTDTTTTQPSMTRSTPLNGRKHKALVQAGITAMLVNAGTGTYDVWGTPYDWIHARNTSEAFDISVPTWVNNVSDLECDFIGNEEHAGAIAVRELIYLARSANKWSVTIVDDPRIEIGDILAFTDGSQLYVEDYSRTLSRGSEAVLDVKGFLVPTHSAPRAETPIGGGGGGKPGTGPGAGGPTLPPITTAEMIGDFALTDVTGENVIPPGDSIRQGYLYCAQPPEERKKWVADWVKLGIKHMWIAPTVNYGGGLQRNNNAFLRDRDGNLYDARGRSGRWAVRHGIAPRSKPYETAIDCRQDPPRFIECVNELKAAGITPYVQIAASDAYGTKDNIDLDKIARDLDSWKGWGWVDAVDGYGTDLWPESDADTYPWQMVDICRMAKETLPNSILMAHVGRSGDGLYQGYGENPGSPDYWGRERFWTEMHAAGCTALGWEAKTEIFEDPDWQHILVREYLGAYTRLTEPLSDEEATERAASVGVTLTQEDLNNLYHGGPAGGASTALPYWEGPEYGLQWASWQKADAARLLIGCGAPGSMSGAVSIPSEALKRRLV